MSEYVWFASSPPARPQDELPGPARYVNILPVRVQQVRGLAPGGQAQGGHVNKGGQAGHHTERSLGSDQIDGNHTGSEKMKIRV